MKIKIESQTIHGNQYIAETMNFVRHMNSQNDIPAVVKKILEVLKEEAKSKAFTEAGVIEAEQHLHHALTEAKQPQPNKSALIDHLSRAEKVVTISSGMVTVIQAAIEAVGILFP